MAIKIKKQYKQSDGSLIEVEGTEAEIEAFEKKQRKQKQQIEAEEKKKTILYGKELEQLRRLIQEEIAKSPVKQEFHYHYPHYYPYYPYYVQPNQWITWTAASSSTAAESSYTLTTTNGINTASSNMISSANTYPQPSNVTLTAGKSWSASNSTYLMSSN